MITLDAGVLDGLAEPTVEAVRAALQQAVELEHATIPVYLYGQFSLDKAANPAIWQILHDVVVEEMLHMCLACNVLNALGGAPGIDAPDFVPRYPGPLPGGVDGGLSVHLRPFSLTQLETYLSIEEPEHPLDFAHDIPPVPSGHVTIGMFYTAILNAIETLGEAAFTGDPARQVDGTVMWGSVVVTDVASAKAAIGLILEQGEGTPASPLEADGKTDAHFYRFKQIAEGYALQSIPGVKGGPPQDDYAYTGEAIPFDPAGVRPVVCDPAQAGYTGAAQSANDAFNASYTTLLRQLHTLFNGKPGADQLNAAIGTMTALEGQANALMAIPLGDGTVAGPSFEYAD